MTRRRWIAEHWDEATATLTGAHADHMARVLRAQPGMEADVVAGGRVFHAQVAAVSLGKENSEVRLNLVAELEAGDEGAVDQQIRVAADGRGEMRVAGECQAEMADILRAVFRLGLAAEYGFVDQHGLVRAGDQF